MFSYIEEKMMLAFTSKKAFPAPAILHFLRLNHTNDTSRHSSKNN